MLDFQQKRKIRGVAYSRITLVIIFLLVLIFARSTWIVYNKKQASENMKNVSLQNVEALRLRNNDLDTKIEKLETSTGIEEEIRLKFNVVKDRENVVMVVESEEEKVATTSQKIGLWHRIRVLLWD